MNTASIRNGRIADAAGIASLSEELGYPTDPGEMERRLSALLSDEHHFVAVAENEDGTILGWIHVERRLSLEGGEKAELQGLVVATEARRSGVGRALVSKGEEWAFAHRLDIIVRSNAIRPEAHEFYPALGFSRIKSQHVYRKKAPR